MALLRLLISQLADGEHHLYPSAAVVLKRDLYVDDLLPGANTFEESLKLKNDLNHLAEKGGFTFRKWASNDPNLIRDLAEKSDEKFMPLQPENSIKILGISWLPSKDSIIVSIKKNNIDKKLTKRQILSDIASFYDPLGLLSPIIMVAKLIMQLMWTLKLSWDEPLPNERRSNWLEFRNQLEVLNEVHFDRFTLAHDYSEIQIHGFCDASERAYAACIYLRTTDKYGKHFSSLLCSKSRVAPIQPVTLPRLELCGALLSILLHESEKITKSS